MFEVTDRLVAPYESICYIQCNWADGSITRASAVIVGPNDVLTALHAVYDSTRGGWTTGVTIIPAADTQPWNRPFGEYTNVVGTIVGRASNWDLDGDGLLTQAESAGDLALIGTNVRIGDVTGWLPVTQMASDFNGQIVGYPAAGSGMMAANVLAD